MRGNGNEPFGWYTYGRQGCPVVLFMPGGFGKMEKEPVSGIMYFCNTGDMIYNIDKERKPLKS